MLSLAKVVEKSATYRDELHTPKPNDIPQASIPHIGINVVQTFANGNLIILLKDLGQGHHSKEEGSIDVLVAMEPGGFMERMHSHQRE